MVKLGGATPQNTIVGQLSKGARFRMKLARARATDDLCLFILIDTDPTFVLVKRATYRLRTHEDAGATIGSENDLIESGSNYDKALSRKRAAPSTSASDKSSVSDIVDITLAYEPGCMVEVARAHKIHGATWASAKVIENDGDFITLQVAPESGVEETSDTVHLPTSMLSSTIRPAPPVESLSVNNERVLNEEVDVHYNNRWCEAYISQVPDARGKMTVCFPGVGVNTDTSLIVFQDSTGQSWIRETWNKTRPKQASIRRGWTFSLYGRWYPRGAATQEFASGGPDLAYKHLAAVSVSEAGDSTKRYKYDEMPLVPASSDQPSNTVMMHTTTTTTTRGSGLGSFVGDSAKGVVTSDETDCPYKSISEACYHLLLTAGPAGLQVSEMVKLIKERSLVKLAGRTPANTLYSRLSQDSRFLNVSRGAYALGTVVAAAAMSAVPSAQKSIADESPRRLKSNANAESVQHSAIHPGFASATPSVAGDHAVSKSCMSELSNASELLLGLRKGKR